jgi:hypothetical protein
MHTNVSISKGGTNLFWDPKGEEKLSKFGWAFVDRILTHANEICLLLNASVNAYRRLDPHFEAPNQIKASPTDRGSMIRIPIGNEKSMRVEVRSVSPDANPYMVMLSVFKTGLEGETSKLKNLRQAERYLPDNIYTAIDDFKKSAWTTSLLGEDVKHRYAELKQASADRCPRQLGTFVKAPEVQFHHARVFTNKFRGMKAPWRQFRAFLRAEQFLGPRLIKLRIGHACDGKAEREGDSVLAFIEASFSLGDATALDHNPSRIPLLYYGGGAALQPLPTAAENRRCG